MLKKLTKAAFVACLAAGLSTPVSAANKTVFTVDGDMQTYMGQYDSDVDGEKAFLDSVGEAHVNFRAQHGAFSFFYQIEAREEKEAAGAVGPNQEFNETIMRLGYHKGGLNVLMGTVQMPTTVPFTNGQGLGTTQVHNTNVDLLLNAGYAESEGLLATYSFTPQVSLAAALYDKAAVSATGVQSGQTMMFGAMGQVAGFAYKVGLVNETVEKHQDNSDSSDNTAMSFSLKRGFGQFVAAVDYSALTVEVGSEDLDKTSMSAQLKVNELGPGSLTVTLTTQDISGDSSIAAVPGVDLKQNMITALVYDLPVEKFMGVRAFYTSNNTEWDSDEAGMDDTTATFIGAGLYGKF